MDIIKCVDFLNRDRLVINWTINLSCNYKCFYCDTRDNIIGPNKELIDNIISYINHISKIKKTILKISGGETTLRSDFNYIIRNLKVDSIIIITNFYKPIEFWKELYSINNDLSLHLSYHHTMVNQDEYFNKCKELIKIGYKNIVPLIMFYPFHKDEIMKFYLKLKTLEQNGIFSVLPRLIRYDMTKDQKLIDWVNNSYPKELYIEYIDSNRIIQRFVSSEELKNTNNNNFKFYKCCCGSYNLSIDTNGHLYFCEAYRQNKLDMLLDLNKGNFKDHDSILEKSTICKLDKCLCELYVPKRKIISRL